jgi:hypothetical protein
MIASFKWNISKVLYLFLRYYVLIVLRYDYPSYGMAWIVICYAAACSWLVSYYIRHVDHPLRITLSSDGTRFNIPANVSHNIIIL